MSRWSRFVNTFRVERITQEIDDELALHVEEGVHAGRTPSDAAHAFGSSLHYREETRDIRIVIWLAEFVQDVRFGVRMLRRNAGFSLLAILCLTVGIGANAAVFSWIEGILLRPYPLVADQDRLFAVTGTERGSADPTDMSWPDFLDLERNCTLVEAFIAEKITGTTLSIGDRAERAPGSIVSANYFDALGVHPILGRGFRPDENTGRNAHPVTVISYQMWQERFHGDPAVVGKTQILNGLPHTIVGVAPQGFYGTFVGWAFQFWVPASMQPQFSAGIDKRDDRGAQWIEGFVRPKPGVTIAQAQTEMSAVMRRLEVAYPDTNRGRGVALFPLWQTPFNNASAMVPALSVALIVVLAVLLIACANVGNLLLVRAFARHQEMTIRLSIGAGRLRLVKQLMTEGLILSVIASAGGLVLANWLRDALAFLTPPRAGVMLRLPAEFDSRVLAVSAAVCIVATVLFGLVPALMTSQIDLSRSLRSQAGAVGGSRRGAWVRSTLVLGQVALSFVLLVGAGLLVRTFLAVRTASPGFSTDGVLTTWVDVFTAGYDPQRARNFQDALIARVRAIPGVQSAALSTGTPFSFASVPSAPIHVDGYESPPDQQPTVEYNAIGPGYLTTMDIPLIAGREFTQADDERAPLRAIVDQTMAAQFWRGRDPVGSRVQVRDRWMEVVGVARAVKYSSLLETPKPYFYVALRQNPARVTAVQIRTPQSPAAMRPLVVGAVNALDSNVAPAEIITMREQVDRTTASQRIAVTMLTIFGGVALLLATVGLYGVMASTVAQSAREMALRMALGAAASDLLRLVLWRTLMVTAAGMAIGAAASLELTRLLGYLLYKVSPRDPVAFGVAAALIGAAAFAACLLPAWRVVRMDPSGALRG